MADPGDQIVFVVDDDPRIREALSMLLSTYDLPVITFGSAAEYVVHSRPDIPACLVLDVHLPDINGLELQGLLDPSSPHIVFITAYPDIPSSVRAMRNGAVDFLTKPLKEAELIRAINAALVENRNARLKQSALADLKERLSRLSPREREVLPLIIGGLLNKQAAAELGISEVTLQIHRGNIMKKMGANSLPNLVRMAGTLQIPLTLSRQSLKGPPDAVEN
ncbi:response regulator transcription factor [Variovorax sp. GT1P44]|uniref:response regulator transcription factor n=1 Tax=Variovorax sp. GT1P44 TaxID=3443742 RepID=UPI003F47AF9A